MQNSGSRRAPAADAAAAGAHGVRGIGVVAAHLPVVPMPLAAIHPAGAAVVGMNAVRRAEFTAALLNLAAAAAAGPSPERNAASCSAPLIPSRPATAIR